MQAAPKARYASRLEDTNGDQNPDGPVSKRESVLYLGARDS